MKKEYVNPQCTPVALLIEEDLLTGGSDMFKTSRFEEEFMPGAPRRVIGGKTA